LPRFFKYTFIVVLRQRGVSPVGTRGNNR
jgi:hypothetical protein